MTALAAGVRADAGDDRAVRRLRRGHADTAGRPNVVQVVVGESMPRAGDADGQPVRLLEANSTT